MGFDTRCANADQRFTCPACYADLPSRFSGRQTCSCGVTSDCTIERIPSYVATVVEGDIEDDADDDFEDDEEDEDE